MTEQQLFNYHEVLHILRNLACELTFLKSYHFAAYDTCDGKNYAISPKTDPNPQWWREEESSVTVAPEGCDKYIKNLVSTLLEDLLLCKIQMYKENNQSYEESFIRYFLTVRKTLKVVKTDISVYENVLQKQKKQC